MRRLVRKLRTRLRDWLGIHQLEALVAKTTALGENDAELGKSLNETIRVVMFDHDVMKRWARESATLKAIEDKHRRQQKGEKIITLPSIASGN